jgi:hypothetical protein
MAHHQGAILMSIANLLKNNFLQKSFMRNPETRAAEYLLEESVIARGKLKTVVSAKPKAKIPFMTEDKVDIKNKFVSLPLMHLISNGRLRSYISNRGGGFLECGNLEIIPFDKDIVYDNSGCHVYISEANGQHIWSTTYQPTLTKFDKYDYRFRDNHATFTTEYRGIISTMTLFQVPGYNAEVRAVSVKNSSKAIRTLDLSSYGEVSLFQHDEYRAQPNFQKMQIVARLDGDNAVSYKKRTSLKDISPVFSHFSLSPDATPPIFCGSKDSFTGKGSLAAPASLREKAPSATNSFDKVYSFRHKVTLLPLEEKTIFYVNLYSGKAERYKEAYEVINDYSYLKTTLDTVLHKPDLSPGDGLQQKILTVLIYRLRKASDFNYVVPVRNEIKINWNLPSVVIEIGHIFSEAVITEGLAVFSKLLKLNFDFNLIVIPHEKDEYSQMTHGFVAAVEQNEQTGAKLVNSTLILNEATLSKELYRGVLESADIYWDVSKATLEETIENKFRKING